MKERVRKRKKFPGTLLFTCATGFMTVQDQAVNADDLMLCLANIHTMEEIDEKRKFQKRYEGWRAHWTGIFRGVVHLWHDGRCRRLKYLAGSPDLTDQPDIGRSVCGTGYYFAGGSMWEMAMTQLIINLRYCLMSFSLSQKFRREESGILKYIAAFGITDEIFGISAAQEGKVSVFYNYGAMCVAIPGWTLGTLVGGISGSLLPDFMLSALSVAIYGMFLAIIIPPSKKSRPVLGVVVASMAVSTIFAVTPVLKQVSSGFMIIITTLLVAGLAAYFCPVEEKEEAAHES